MFNMEAFGGSRPPAHHMQNIDSPYETVTQPQTRSVPGQEHSLHTTQKTAAEKVCLDRLASVRRGHTHNINHAWREGKGGFLQHRKR